MEWIVYIIVLSIFVATLGAWWYLYKTTSSTDWRILDDRREINQPIDFPCRRVTVRRESDEGEGV